MTQYADIPRPPRSRPAGGRGCRPLPGAARPGRGAAEAAKLPRETGFQPAYRTPRGRPGPGRGRFPDGRLAVQEPLSDRPPKRLTRRTPIVVLSGLP